MLIKIFLLLILILINGIFSATEIAFLSLNKYELNKEVKKKNKKAIKISELLKDSSTFLSAIQIAITLSGLLASAFAAENFASELSNKIKINIFPQETVTTILVVMITFILSYFSLVLGELVPKKIGLTYSDKIAFQMIGVIEIIIHICKPFIIILRSSTNFILKFLKIKRKKSNIEELKNSITDLNLEKLEKQLLLDVFIFNNTTLKKAMTPKEEVITLDINISKEEIFQVIKEYKFTRFPITDGEDIIGVFNIKDLVIKHNEMFQLKDYIQKIVPLKDTTSIFNAYIYLNSKDETIAKVIKNEKYIGIITLEDIIKKLIENVFDESNQN